MIQRRYLLNSTIAFSVMGLAKFGNTVPILSGNNYGLTYDKATRMNGWAEINVHAFEQNIKSVLQKIGKASLCLVIKANAYGHGLDLLLPIIIKNNCNILGFTSNEEARIARELGYKGRLIRIRSAGTGEISDAIQYGVEELIGGMDLAATVNDIAKNNKVRIPVHLMLNSAGMGRNGLDLGTETGKDDARKMPVLLSNITIVGIATHFPIENQNSINSGLKKFQTDCSWLFNNTSLRREDVMLHAANSYATLNVPDARLDMVRCGACLYDAILGERQVMSFKTRVAAVLSYPTGSTISYDSTWVLRRDSKIANIPVGYSDGFRRLFSTSNKENSSNDLPYALIRGQKAPILGRITMNTLLVDVTDIPEVLKDDEVVLLGRQGMMEISWKNWLVWSGAGLYELVTLLGNSVPKVISPHTV